MTKLFKNHEWRFIFHGDRLECMQKKKIEKRDFNRMSIYTERHIVRDKKVYVLSWCRHSNVSLL